MNNICQHVGNQIKKYRKMRGHTLSEFAARINKSVSTVSKYESGTISIDILTLSEIAQALEVTIEQLLPASKENGKEHFFETPAQIDSRNFFMRQNLYYMYYFFPPEKKSVQDGVAISAIEIQRNSDAMDDVCLYNECLNPKENYKDCKFVYRGKMLCYDFITYFMLENLYHVGCHDYICAKVPFSHAHTTTGLYVGISESIRNPAATRIIISDTLIDVTADMIQKMTLNTRETKQDFAKYNSLIAR